MLNSFEGSEEAAFVIPPQATSLYKSKEVFRSQVLKLDYIVTTYNNFMASMRDEDEKPLLRQELDQFEAEMQKGMRDLHWHNSDLIDDFVARLR